MSFGPADGGLRVRDRTREDPNSFESPFAPDCPDDDDFVAEYFRKVCTPGNEDPDKGELWSGNPIEGAPEALAVVLGFLFTTRPADCVTFLHGAEGGNGKSLLCNRLAKALGPAMATMPSSIICGGVAKQGATDSALVRTKGKRCCSIRELSESDRLNEAKFKGFTGDDIAEGRDPRKSHCEWAPTVKFVVATNVVPPAPPGKAAAKRFLVFPFVRSFATDSAFKATFDAKGDHVLRHILSAVQRFHASGETSLRRYVEGVAPSLAKARLGESASFVDYAKAHCERNDEGRVVCAKLVDDWAAAEGISAPAARERLYDHMESHLGLPPRKKCKVDGSAVLCWRGMTRV